MDRPRYLSVPVNEKGIEEYDCGVEDTKNIKTFMLSQEEFNILYNQGVFDQINKQCNLLIDDYESEVITNAHFDICKKIINSVDVPIFEQALNLAIKHNTVMGLDF